MTKKILLWVLLGLVVGAIGTATLLASPSGDLAAVVVNNASNAFDGGLSIGVNGSLIAKHITATASYNPPSLADGVVATTTVTLTGAVAGDICLAGFTLYGTTGGINVTCQISAADTALVTMDNESGVTRDNATGTLRASVWQY